MTDHYLQALDDVAAELTKLQQRGPDLPAFHRGQILEQLGTLAGAIEELRRRRQAPAQDPGPVPSDWAPPDPRLDLMRGFRQLATGEPPTGHHRPSGAQVEFGPPRSALDPVAEAPGPVPRCGDHVLHRPSGETWVVAWADAATGDLAWTGWPDGRAKLSDCDLIKRATEEEHRAAVDRWAASAGGDSRRALVLALYGAPAPADPVAEDRADWDAAPRW